MGKRGGFGGFCGTKLEQLRQKAMLAADSSQELSREQSILSAQQSLGKGATQEQIALAGKYAAQAYDVAAAIKAQQKAEKERQDTESAYARLGRQHHLWSQWMISFRSKWLP